MSAPISVVIPVGPEPHQTAYLGECLDSVRAQTLKPDEILVLDGGYPKREYLVSPGDDVRLWQSPWLTGIAVAFNFGVSLAKGELVILLGSDDKLMPDCVEQCWRFYNEQPDPMGFYFMACEYSNGFTQNVPCLAGMVTKHLWKVTGGLPLGSDYGANDWGLPVRSCEIVFHHRLLISGGKMGVHRGIGSKPLYWVRIHTPGSVGIKK